MFFAINSKTGEKVNTLTIETNPSYQFISEEEWYADPDEIETCPKEIDITQIKVIFRKGHLDIINFQGTKYDRSPSFYIPNAKKLGINIIPESLEHKLAKNWIYNKIQHNNLVLAYSTANKPYKYQNTINMFDLPLDKNLIGIEVTSQVFAGKISRRADVICPFLKKHELFGKGIVFEIQFSNQRNRTKIDRELDWAIRGYSVCWLFKDDFNNITDLIIDLKENKVNIDSYASLIKQNNKHQIRDLKIITQECSRQIDYKKEELQKELQKELSKELPSYVDKALELKLKEIPEIVKRLCELNQPSSQPTCPKCLIKATLRKNFKNGDMFWGCINYPKCKWTMPYMEK